MATEDEEFEALSKKLDAPTIHITKRKTSNMKIILIGHKKRQGKDTFAKYLEQYLVKNGVMPKHLSFAHPMKKIIAEALDVDMETLNSMKNGSLHYRLMLQKFGSGLMKKYFGDTVWRDLAIQEIREFEKAGFDCVIVSDFRFPCEYIDGAVTINIDMDGGNGDTHISETALDGYSYDFKIKNNETIKELEAKAEAMAIMITDGSAWQ